MKDYNLNEDDLARYPGGRMMLIIKHYGLNKNTFSKAIGDKNNSVVLRIINDPARSPSMDMIKRILTRFPQVNCRWFVLGEGEMLLRKEDQPGYCKGCDMKERIIKSQQETITALNETINYYMTLNKKEASDWPDQPKKG